MDSGTPSQSDWHSPVSLSSLSEPLSYFSIGAPSVRPLSPPGDSSSGATSHIRDIAQGHCEKQQNRDTQGESHPMTFFMLPDDVLLEIFDFYRKDHDYTFNPVWNWHLLAHVCRTWRQIIFASPHHLDLKILYTYGFPVRKNLDSVWPAYPIVIRYNNLWYEITPDDEDNIICALEHRDRVCDIELQVGAVLWGSRSEKFDTAVQQPFPVLTRLYIHSGYGDAPATVLPTKFLGGSAPRLQEITLSGTPYPTLPMLLLSASDLVKLDLWDIPPTGYISPEAMVACLATLPRLVHLAIGFRSDTSRPDRIRPLPITRTVIPALTSFRFVGASEYLEDLVAQIDGPQLNQITIDYLRLVGYQITQFSEFVNRSVGPKLTLYRSARVHFFSDSVSFIVSDRGSPEVFMLCGGVNWHVLDISRLLGHFRTPLSNVVHLHLGVGLEVNPRYEDMVNVDWLHLLRQFSTAQTLHLSRQPAEYVARSLNVISVELVAEVLPSLDLICLVGQLFRTSSMEKFVDKLIAARELSGCPVTVVDVLSETECDEGLESYVRK